MSADEVSAPRHPLHQRIEPGHIYRGAGLLFLLAIAIKFFDPIVRVFLLIYAAAILGILFNALRGVIPLQRKLLAASVGVGGIALLGVVLWFAVPALAGQVRGIVEMAPDMREQVESGIDWFEARTGIPIPDVGEAGVAAPAGGMGEIFGRAATALEIIFIPFILFFGGLFAVARPNERLLSPVLRIFREDQRLAWYRIFQLLSVRILGWLKGTGIAMVAVGLLSTIAYTIIGVPNSLAVGIFAGIVEFIPIFGPWIGGIVATAVALVDDPTKALWTILATVVIQQIESNVITPWAMSQAAEIHPFVTLFAIVFFGSLFGFLGILLALPLVLLFWTLVQVLWVERAIDTDDDRIRPVARE